MLWILLYIHTELLPIQKGDYKLIEFNLINKFRRGNMKRFTTVLVSGIAVLFLSACGGGGGGSSTPPAPALPSEPVGSMMEKEYITITLHSPSDTCGEGFQQDGEYIFSVENNSVTCATYGRTDGIATAAGMCRVEDLASIDSNNNQYGTSCVMGFGDNSLAASINPNDPMTEKLSISISYNVDSGSCYDKGYSPSAVNPIYREETNSISCADYGRVAGKDISDASTGCSETDMHEISAYLWPITGVACVWGFDIALSAAQVGSSKEEEVQLAIETMLDTMK